MRLMEQLRIETREQHLRLHEVVDLARLTSSVKDYIAGLSGFFCAVAPAEESVLRLLAKFHKTGQPCDNWPVRTQKTQWLRNDLQWLGAWKTDEPDQQRRQWSSTETAVGLAKAYRAEDLGTIDWLRSAGSERDEGQVPELVGRAYVLEGMTLGATRIAPLVRESLGLDENSGARFFHAYGSDVGMMWRKFGDWVEHLAVEPDIAVAAARRTFSYFEGGL